MSMIFLWCILLKTFYEIKIYVVNWVNVLISVYNSMNIYVYSFKYVYMSTYLPRKVPCCLFLTNPGP